MENKWRKQQAKQQDTTTKYSGVLIHTVNIPHYEKTDGTEESHKKKTEASYMPAGRETD
jgi:hypothetical protein